MASFFLVTLAIPLLVTAKLPGMDMSMDEMMKAFSEMEDEYSTVLTEANYQSVLTNNTNPWFIFFTEPRSFQSTIKNPPWIIFAGHVKGWNSTLNIGRVDMSVDVFLRRKFKISSFPAFVYLRDGFAYNYSGPAEVEDLERFVNESLYLQYDRQPFTVENTTLPLKAVFRKDFIKNPGLFIGGIFASSFLFLLGFTWMCCKSKAGPGKAPERAPDSPTKKKKRE